MMKHDQIQAKSQNFALRVTVQDSKQHVTVCAVKKLSSDWTVSADALESVVMEKENGHVLKTFLSECVYQTRQCACYL